MLNIDKNIFADNLLLTQAYCHLQIANNNKDNAAICRTYNPPYKNKHLFHFEIEYFGFEIKPGIKHCTLTKWAIDPMDEKIINDLFIDQLNYKKQHVVYIDKNNIGSGKILVSQIDCTVVDGASEMQSLGLIDLYDMPPIDTWFYMANTKESRLLFAWIPNELVHYANEAIAVNCIDCINWFEECYPKDNELLLKHFYEKNNS